MGIASIPRACLLLLAIPPIHAADYPVVTVCEVLHDLAFYNGKTLIVVGKKSAGTEGSWLVQDCPAKLVKNDGWGHDLSLANRGELIETPPTLPQGFKWDTEAVKSKLMEVKETTKLNVLDRGEYLYEDQWTVVFGRLETMIPLQNDAAPGVHRIPEGFGHENGRKLSLSRLKAGFMASRPQVGD